MKTLPSLVIGATAAALVAVSAPLAVRAANPSGYAPEWEIAGNGQICVERWEDNGSANIWPLHVSFGNQTEAILVGGRAVCTFAEPGKYNVSIDWLNSRGKRQSGNVQPVIVLANKTSALFICNTQGGPGPSALLGQSESPDPYSGWIIQVVSKKTRERCK